MKKLGSAIKFAFVIFVILVAFVFAQSWAQSHYVGRAQAAAQSTLLLVSEAIDQAVGRFRPIPGLIAGDPALRNILQEDAQVGTSPFINEKLRQTALSVGASEIYVMDRTGLTIAASNYRDEDTFLGKNFAFRPYFSNSLAGQSAIFHALGTTSGERGFFFSAPILDGIDVIGVLAVKITVGAIERDWLGAGHEILISDNNGIVFLTSREDFKYRALAPLTDATRARISETQQYPMEQVSGLGLSANVIEPDAVIATVESETGAERFLTVSQPLDFPGWHAIVFTSMQLVQRQVFWTMALGGLALTAVALFLLVLWQRRANTLQRIRTEQEQRVLLEEKVRERTTDLNHANSTLGAEVAERRLAEERLRKSQRELVQAGKLAALGQMSAAISHEINQPLAAIKSYAVNATEYLARSRVEDAKSNIESISVMSDRMTEISSHLRNFARQPGDKLKPINVAKAIDETVGLVGPQLRAKAAAVRVVPLPEDIWALGGQLRLQQVLVNIITNALEAMSDQKAPLLEIGVTATDEQVAIKLRDHGPGIPQETMDHVFDAFYTTKDAGAGMGLGMSISQNIISDFGGALSAENHPDGGAVFTVMLQRQLMTEQVDACDDA